MGLSGQFVCDGYSTSTSNGYSVLRTLWLIEGMCSLNWLHRPKGVWSRKVAAAAAAAAAVDNDNDDDDNDDEDDDNNEMDVTSSNL